MTNVLLQAMQAHHANMRPGFNDGTSISGFQDAIEFVRVFMGDAAIREGAVTVEGELISGLSSPEILSDSPINTMSALAELVRLKEYKDKHGKDLHYIASQKGAWLAARHALANIGTELAQYEIPVTDGRLEAYRDIWRSFQNNKTMEYREAERWMLGFMECYINEVEGTRKDLYADQISAFFEMPRPPVREINHCKCQENCPMCNADTTVSYWKSWHRHYSCKGCGFRDTGGILGEPPCKTDIEGQKP